MVTFTNIAECQSLLKVEGNYDMNECIAIDFTNDRFLKDRTNSIIHLSMTNLLNASHNKSVFRKFTSGPIVH